MSRRFIAHAANRVGEICSRRWMPQAIRALDGAVA
jgi:hypothetical protein